MHIHKVYKVCVYFVYMQGSCSEERITTNELENLDMEGGQMLPIEELNQNDHNPKCKMKSTKISSCKLDENICDIGTKTESIKNY